MGTDEHLLGWLLDERSTIGRENLDPAHVARYDGKEDVVYHFGDDGFTARYLFTATN